ASSRNIQVCGRSVDDLDLRTWLCTNLSSILLVSRRACVIDSIAAANNSAAFEPWNGPAETDRRGKVVPVILVGQHVGIRRVLAGRFDCRQRTTSRIRVPEGAKVGSRNTEEPGLSAFHASRHSCEVIRNAVLVIPQTQVQCEIARDFPIV